MQLATPSTTFSACFIQCSAALVKTASKRHLRAESLAVHDKNLSTVISRRLKLRQAGIAAVDCAARGNDLFRQRTVAAAEVQDGLAGLAIEQRQQWLAEVGNETRVLGVAIRIPGGCLSHERQNYHFAAVLKNRNFTVV